MIRFLALTVLLSGVSALAGEFPGRISDNQLVVAPNVVLAGKLHAPALAAVDSAGIVVIDLRTPGEGIAEEADHAWRLGIPYRNVPVAGAELHGDQVAEVARLLAGAGERTVLIHCASGNRAALLWGAVQIDAGRPLDDVLAALAPLEVRQPVRDALADYAVKTGPDEPVRGVR